MKIQKVDVGNLKDDNKEFIKNNKLILKTQQRFRSKKHNEFTEEINKIALSSNDDKRTQSIDLIETNAHGTSNIQYVRRKKLNGRHKRTQSKLARNS